MLATGRVSRDFSRIALLFAFVCIIAGTNCEANAADALLVKRAEGDDTNAQDKAEDPKGESAASTPTGGDDNDKSKEQKSSSEQPTSAAKDDKKEDKKSSSADDKDNKDSSTKKGKDGGKSKKDGEDGDNSDSTDDNGEGGDGGDSESSNNNVGNPAFNGDVPTFSLVSPTDFVDYGHGNIDDQIQGRYAAMLIPSVLALFVASLY
ncbi:hypothetical protein H4219_001525 [Mycoemilia scoparia]|uniref:Uncharacterized protein n=1 Tax=Mycoemilia scoparia TaxID=417184 RepID=A0A9W8A011_9FUNG|nr:hypothetical protein H4219_001525 [Mycoemilia scoparia]